MIFKNFKRSLFGDSIFSGKIIKSETDKKTKQSNE